MSYASLPVVFAAFAIAAVAWRIFLAVRQMRHVALNRDSVPPDFAELIPLEAHRKAADYTLDKQRAGLVETIVIDGIALLAITIGGGLAAIERGSRAIFGEGHLHDLGTVFGLALLLMALALPFDAWRTFVIEERHGFNRTTPGLFIRDMMKGALLSLALGTPLLLLIFWFVHATGPFWWFYTWFAWILFTLAIVTVYPRWIAPVFNRFTPLEDGALRSRIEALVERCGFHASGLFVMDGSRRTSHGNAYFGGLGVNKRIVFFDTLIEKLTASEIEAVLAHELGHFAKGHIPRLLGVRFALAFVLLAILGWLYREPGFYHLLGLEHRHIGVALAGFALIVPVFTFPFQPLASLMARRQEFEADAFAAQHASAADLRSALAKLYRDNAATLTPDPLHSLVYDSHPPAALRIDHLKRGPEATSPS